jgi:hypothetical protein
VDEGHEQTLRRSTTGLGSARPASGRAADLPFVAWIAALVGIVCGLMILLPRVTVAQKIMSWVGMAACIAAVVLLVG